MDIIVGKHNKLIKIDKEDYIKLKLGDKERCIYVTGHGYAAIVTSTGVRTENGWYKYNRQYLHRAIMNPPKNMQVDHINGDKLDNRKENLRICTNQQNSFNKKQNPGSSKGVFYVKSSGAWIAQISIDGKTHHLGSYDDENSAAIAYNEASRKYHGEYGFTNDVDYSLSVNKRKTHRKKPEHGTITMYSKYKCRCNDCRDAAARANAKYRGTLTKDTRARSIDYKNLKDTHGTAASYKHGKCRCDDCRMAYRIYQRKFIKK